MGWNKIRKIKLSKLHRLLREPLRCRSLTTVMPYYTHLIEKWSCCSAENWVLAIVRVVLRSSRAPIHCCTSFMHVELHVVVNLVIEGPWCLLSNIKNSNDRIMSTNEHNGIFHLNVSVKRSSTPMYSECDHVTNRNSRMTRCMPNSSCVRLFLKWRIIFWSSWIFSRAYIWVLPVFKTALDNSFLFACWRSLFRWTLYFSEFARRIHEAYT